MFAVRRVNERLVVRLTDCSHVVSFRQAVFVEGHTDIANN